ncbi:hypothetical protein PQQ86_38605 [Paraburkholderia sediminicola]|uniref:hypothetical protein n=1 Tax=Paraburkholderia sediminicola TaxID=458836 RepID=UPI0038BD4254
MKRWLYEHLHLIAHDRLLKRLIVQAGRDVEGSLTDRLGSAFGDAMLSERLGFAECAVTREALEVHFWLIPQIALEFSRHLSLRITDKAFEYAAAAKGRVESTRCNPSLFNKPSLAGRTEAGRSFHAMRPECGRSVF